ncbi:acetate/propionate family kinase [Marivita sp. S2033]|uniref:acetate/propionate family kinase n=1 Tax=Marivita sp. S2033 TaxID=3373187 RepID=UPI003982B945
MADGLIVTMNAGSSSLRCGVFRLGGGAPQVIRRLSIRGLTGDMVASERDLVTGAHDEIALGTPDSPEAAHRRAFEHMVERLNDVAQGGRIAGFAHRVVHGGAEFAAPVEVTDAVLERLAELAPLAPSHQIHNLRPIRKLRDHYPGVPQIACFDTAFHRTQPRLAQLYGLPRDLTEDGILRYGFHGLSYESIAGSLRQSCPEIADKRVIVAHLGNGVSMCALNAGRSIATTMGLTALDGMPMGQRSGALDPGAVLHLIIDRGHSPEAVRDMLYTRSGMLGVSDISGEMNDLLASDRPEAQEAVDFFVYRFGRTFGSLMGALGGVDGVVLTAGMGEHIAALRARLINEIRWAGAELDVAANDTHGPRLTTEQSRLPVWMLRTDEEQVLAQSASALLGRIAT